MTPFLWNSDITQAPHQPFIPVCRAMADGSHATAWQLPLITFVIIINPGSKTLSQGQFPAITQLFDPRQCQALSPNHNYCWLITLFPLENWLRLRLKSHSTGVNNQSMPAHRRRYIWSPCTRSFVENASTIIFAIVANHNVVDGREHCPRFSQQIHSRPEPKFM